MSFQHILRNPGSAPLGDKQLRAYAPAVFTQEPHPDVSERYGFIPSYKVHEALVSAGYQAVEARNYMRRKAALLQFTKHLIRYQKAGPVAKLQVGDVVPQLVFLGSHDRSSNFEFYGGLWRLVCENGMMVSDSPMVTPIKLRHTKNIVEGVLDAVATVAKQHSKVFDHVADMRKVKLNDKQQLKFAQEALALRYPHAGVIDASVLLDARRPEDKGDDVWHVFQRVQENLIKGGLVGKTADGRVTRTHGNQSIGSNVRINCGLWNLAMQSVAKH